ncbi:hypothetical protein GCM10009546_49570 [Actinomadura livida]|uniref:Uma2 family endonuclease n=1 Tax=Actinomadura livida TaxID=79909 RepID=A0ABP3Q212_9ACTN|nr:hypothetical protein GCM10010208_52980 [Actinomadura livida]
MTRTEVFSLDGVSEDTLSAMWMRGEVDDLLDLPFEGMRVEIIGGQIVVSPAPNVAHAGILSDISAALTAMSMKDPEYPWMSTKVVNLYRQTVNKFCIPDRSIGAYLHQESWEFGETVQLPEPFNVEIETSRWRPWK